jgi:putative ABC transport system permease protein
LAVGIAVFLVLFLDVRFETSFERWIPNASQIYEIRTTYVGQLARLGAYNATMGGLLDELRGDYPQLVGTRIQGSRGTVRQGAKITPEDVALVDPSFFKVFDLPLVDGDKTTALTSPDGLVISQTKAKTYFGDTNPVGQTLNLAFNGAMHVFKITGVLRDPPPNTDLTFTFMARLKPPTKAENPYWTHWGSNQLETYFRFATPREAQALDANFDGFTDRHAATDPGQPPFHKIMKLRTQPLLSLHLLEPKDAAVISGLGAVGLLTLLLAAVNYVNLATARAGLRAREVALRKVMGAPRSALIGQFMAEALATVALGTLLGVALCELALPLVNAAGGLTLKIDYFGDPAVPLTVLMTAVAVGVGAGAYPAVILSQFRPAAVLASAKTPGGGRAGGRLREGLVVVQFAIAIAFTIATGVIVSQTSYLRHADIGLKRDGLIVVHSFDDDQVTAAQQASLLAAWRALPGAVDVTQADIGPGVDDNDNNANFIRPGQKGDGIPLGWVNAGPDFFKTYGAHLIAGRWPDPAYGGDYRPEPAHGAAVGPKGKPLGNVIVNARAVRAIGFASPQAALGQTLLEGGRPATIIGVVADIRFRSPKDPVPPTVYFGQAGHIDNAAAGVRYASADPRAVMDAMAAQWRKIVPDVVFQGKTAEDNLAEYYKADDQHGRLFIIGALLAVLIGCVGLYGLASFNTARRVKEIGIRKTLGASTSDILKLLVGQFLRPVVVANVFAWPLAWWAMTGYLSGFDQRIALTPAYFLAATALTLLIAVGAVAGQAYAVARAEPAKALRRE